MGATKQLWFEERESKIGRVELGTRNLTVD
jgi:hypothetical protein